jgi:hypothetical protein
MSLQTVRGQGNYLLGQLLRPLIGESYLGPFLEKLLHDSSTNPSCASGDENLLILEE